MADFNTHGGYFAPKGYLRINEGGSHDENRYGGVQVGVDQNGTPNMLEQDESVYNDYVYSDNIYADGGILAQHNLPQKYNGKLYSEIADAILKDMELEDNELDPIANKGAEVFFRRLAEAQEQQKQEEQQRELEEELSQLSPEELDQLEAMLAQQGQAPQGEMMPQEQMAPEEQMMGPAEPMPQEAMAMPGQEQVPVMANGGFIQTFEGGGNTEPDGDEDNNKFNLNYGDSYQPVQLPSLLELTLGSDHPVVQGANQVRDAYGNFVNNTFAGKVIDAFLPDDATQAFSSPMIREIGRATGPFRRSIARGAKKAWGAIKSAPGKIVEAKGRGELFKGATEAAKEAKNAARTAKNIANDIADDLETAKAALKADPTNAELKRIVEELSAKSKSADRAAMKAARKRAGARAKAAVEYVEGATTGPMRNHAAYEAEVEGLRRAYEAAKATAEAAPESAELAKAAEEALEKLNKAQGWWNKWVNHGEWTYKAPLWSAYPLYRTFDSNAERRDDWVEDQAEGLYARGGKMNLFYGGGDSGATPGALYMNYPSWAWRGMDGLPAYDIVTPGFMEYFPPQSVIDMDWWIDSEDSPLNQVAGSGTSGQDAGGRSGAASRSGVRSTRGTAPVVSSYNGLVMPQVNSWEDFFNLLENYRGSSGRSNTKGRYGIDRDARFWSGRTGKEVEGDKIYDEFTEYVRTHPDDPNVMKYFGLLDKLINTSNGARRLIENGKLVDDWWDIYDWRRHDGVLGGYHLTPNDLSFLADEVAKQRADGIAASLQPLAGISRGVNGLVGVDGRMPGSIGGENKNSNSNLGDVAPKSDPEKAKPNTGANNDVEVVSPSDWKYKYLSTLPRYASAVGSGLLGLYDLFQQPDEYHTPRLTPHLPYGSVHFQNVEYNPVDREQIVNGMRAQTNAALRGISGTGPSVGQNVIALDNGATGNYGTGYLQAIDANNQLLNNVITLNNNSEQSRANFYAMLDRYRQAELSRVDAANSQASINDQIRNNAAESEYYQAIGNQINLGLNALKNIGDENQRLNMINSDPSNLGWRVGANGVVNYFPNSANSPQTFLQQIPSNQERQAQVGSQAQPVTPGLTVVQSPTSFRAPRISTPQMLDPNFIGGLIKKYRK